jgi:hypothetical protein
MVAGGLDARTFLRTGQGSCTSNANLFAALMRANGVPCRVYNMIMMGAGQDMHFTNEYWVNGRGWVHVEPQGQEIQTPRTLGIATGIVYPAMDDRADSPYFMSLFGTELDANGRPREKSAPALVATKGLAVENDPLPGGPKYFAATQPRS